MKRSIQLCTTVSGDVRKHTTVLLSGRLTVTLSVSSHETFSDLTSGQCVIVLRQMASVTQRFSPVLTRPRLGAKIGTLLPLTAREKSVRLTHPGLIAGSHTRKDNRSIFDGIIWTARLQVAA